MAEEQDRVLERSIIVVGAQRSGTAFLGGLLAAHPDLSYIGEPRLTWKYGNERKSDALSAADASPRVRRHIRATFAQMAIEMGGSRIVEKSPANSLRMAFVEEVLPGCRFVHITRNGVDSVLSARSYWQRFAHSLKTQNWRTRIRELKLSRLPYYARELAQRASPSWLAPVVGRGLWGVRIPGLQELARELDVLDVCSLQWRACVEAACQYGRRLPADRYFECRLEDMSMELLRSILDFCDLEVTQEVIDHYEGRYTHGRASKRKRDADPKEVERIMQWIEPTMQWLGYQNRPM
jgi:hypothetical protein